MMPAGIRSAPGDLSLPPVRLSLVSDAGPEGKLRKMIQTAASALWDDPCWTLRYAPAPETPRFLPGRQLEAAGRRWAPLPPTARLSRSRSARWWPRQESNLYLPLRRGLFCPLNHGAAPGEFCTMTRPMTYACCNFQPGTGSNAGRGNIIWSTCV